MERVRERLRADGIRHQPGCNPLLRPLRRRVLAMLADLQRVAGAAG